MKCVCGDEAVEGTGLCGDCFQHLTSDLRLALLFPHSGHFEADQRAAFQYLKDNPYWE